MSVFNTKESYGSLAKIFHWVIAVFVIGMLIYGFLLDSVPKEYRSAAFYSHKLLGMVILSLMLLRVLWTLLNQKPVLPFATKWWESFAERLVHYGLYLTVIAMPLVGWIGSVAAGRAPYIGDFKFNLPIEQNKALSHWMFKIHKQLAFVIIALLIIHVSAALYHHFVRKDVVLKRMLP